MSDGAWVEWGKGLWLNLATATEITIKSNNQITVYHGTTSTQFQAKDATYLDICTYVQDREIGWRS